MLVSQSGISVRAGSKICSRAQTSEGIPCGFVPRKDSRHSKRPRCLKGNGYLLIDILCIIASVAILWKTADWFVEGAVGIAEKLGVPHMFVGLVIVSIATTSPELMASLLAAIEGRPEMALGNAIGSVSFDAGVALGLAALLSSKPLVADPGIFKSSAIMLIAVFILAFIMSLDGTLARQEGALLVGCYVVYISITYIYLSRLRKAGEAVVPAEELELEEIEAELGQMSTGKIALLFAVGLLGVLLGAKLLLAGAVGLAEAFGVPNVIIGLFVVALGTSVPEIATCVTSALKGKSGIGIGNIIGADILNICWVAGLSATANPLSAPKETMYVMFPGVFVIVIAMLGMLWHRYSLNRVHGVILLLLYVVYAIITFSIAGEALPTAH